MRHISFWVICYAGLASVGMVMPSFFNPADNNRFLEYFLVPVLYIPAQIFLVYITLYLIIPRFILQLKYRKAIIWFILMSLIAGAIAAIIYAAIIESIRVHFVKPEGFTFERIPWSFSLATGFINGLRYALTVAGFAAALKLMKSWYEKEHRNSILQKEKLNAELQSLKAQVHPHFLFNTLNNIYSLTQDTSPKASGMILKLSDLLRHILYNCDAPLVQLSQEFKILEDYIALEKARYPATLDLSFSRPENSERFYIAPLLLLPIVENCFKHGASKTLEQPWISIHAEMKENTLLMKLINGIPPVTDGEAFSFGLGLNNVKKRLELLYPGKHELNIMAEEDVFIVNLKMELVRSPVENIHG